MSLIRTALVLCFIFSAWAADGPALAEMPEYEMSDAQGVLPDVQLPCNSSTVIELIENRMSHLSAFGKLIELAGLKKYLNKAKFDATIFLPTNKVRPALDEINHAVMTPIECQNLFRTP